MSDEPRLLARNAARAYTNNPIAALRGEPEAISVDAQEQITAAAARDRHDQLTFEWGKTRDRLLGAVEHFEEVVNPGTGLRRQTRALRRVVAAVDREVSGQTTGSTGSSPGV